MREDTDDAADALVREEASGWFGRMHGEPTPGDRTAFARWLGADARNRAAYQRLEHRWDQSTFLAGSPLARSRDLDRAAVWWHRSPVRWWLAGGLAAAMLALVIIGAGLWPAAPRPAAELVANREATVKRVRLADRSTIVLDRNAAIEIAFTGSERRLRLVRGRARFEVAPDRARPFVVAAEDGEVIARGTVFDVALARRTVEVTVLEGQVEVCQAARAGFGANRRAETLRPGQRASFTFGQPVTEPRPAPAGAPDWAAAMVTFDNTRLADAAAVLSRPGQVRIEVRGSAAALTVSGAFRADDPAGFARAAAAMFSLSLKQRGTLMTLEPKK